ncbi:hypothetical protein PPYR_03393 [Photinus pyralis]|uniref:Uncharacterized protein n=1 Tax=Photinus pyralis TaxID=7054 RepID=A0A5N4A2P0_PHOPY|nr:hypothetical protein PPYR_03393 [Photinus pyralis]
MQDVGEKLPISCSPGNKKKNKNKIVTNFRVMLVSWFLKVIRVTRCTKSSCTIFLSVKLVHCLINNILQCFSPTLFSWSNKHQRLVWCWSRSLKHNILSN